MGRRSAVVGAAFVLGILAYGSTRTIAAQEPKGPLAPPPNREVIRIPVEPTPPPPIPAEEIIRRFAQKEDEFLHARAAYIFRKTVRVQEFDEDGKPAGEFSLTTEPAVAADGRRYERVVQQPSATLRRMTLAPEDVEMLARMPMFPLTTDQLGKYELTYAGKQTVDELTTYLFRVKPKQLERTRAYFEGLVWVDDRDLLIVKTYGKWVTEVGDVASPEFPFTFFETYRENIDRKYWFPTYARSDGTLKLKNAELHVRLTVRWTDYKPLAPAASPESTPRNGTRPPTPAQPRPPQNEPTPQ